MRRLVRSFRTSESGEGVVEYAFLIALVAAVLIGVLQAFRGSVAGVTERAAVTISSQGAGYGAGAPGPPPGHVGGGGPSTSLGRDDDRDDDEEDPDASPPDSVAAPGIRP